MVGVVGTCLEANEVLRRVLRKRSMEEVVEREEERARENVKSGSQSCVCHRAKKKFHAVLAVSFVLLSLFRSRRPTCHLFA